MLHRFLLVPLRLAVLASAAAVLAAAAQAADNTRYLSVTGSNANSCTLAQPCRTLQKAINSAPPGGEVRILESGFFGNNALINKSLTISGNGHTVYLGAVLTINKANASVALRGLVLDGQGVITNGISIAAAETVHIERCLVHNFTGVGISITANLTNVLIADTISRNNGGSGLQKAGTSQAVIDNSHFSNNTLDGVRTLGGHTTIRRSTTSGNGNDGIFTSTSVTAVSTVAARNGNNGYTVNSFAGPMILESSVADNNGAAGLRAGGEGGAIISNSTFTRNATGISSSGDIGTRQNNTVVFNTTNLTGNAPVPIGGI